MDSGKRKQFIIIFIFVLGFLILAFRLFYIQVLDTSYKELAERNTIREIWSYPARGLIYDRNDNLLVKNEPVYDLMVIPRNTGKIDTTLLQELLHLKPFSIDSLLQSAIDYSQYKPSVFYKRMTNEQLASILEHMYKLPGFFLQVKTARIYPYKNASHVLGYLGEVNQAMIDTTDYYLVGDYIGISGVEQSYESRLRGTKGIEFVMVDVHNREIGKYKDGEDDIPPIAGKDVHLTIDIDLQKFGENLLQGKNGSIIAIDPRNGEVLSLISSPFYNPNVLTGKGRSDEFKILNEDVDKPLFNRAISAKYPPGSTIKPLVGLIALEQNVIKPDFYFPCNGQYELNNLVLACSHNHKSAKNIYQAIKESCNPYFWEIFRLTISQDHSLSTFDLYNQWLESLQNFGLGLQTKIDLPNEISGSLPTGDYYNQVYGKDVWTPSHVISLGIGQGELSITPIQMANLACIIANKGNYYAPHLMKPNGIIAPDNFEFKEHKTHFDLKNFEEIIRGLELAVKFGSGKTADIPGIEVCGKTGTSQNPHGDDHSLFIGFAPKDNPQIAVAVVVENAGFGSNFGAPIGGLLMEKYLTDSISTSRIPIYDFMINQKIESTNVAE